LETMIKYGFRKEEGGGEQQAVLGGKGGGGNCQGKQGIPLRSVSDNGQANAGTNGGKMAKKTKKAELVLG